MGVCLYVWLCSLHHHNTNNNNNTFCIQNTNSNQYYVLYARLSFIILILILCTIYYIVCICQPIYGRILAQNATTSWFRYKSRETPYHSQQFISALHQTGNIYTNLKMYKRKFSPVPGFFFISFFFSICKYTEKNYEIFPLFLFRTHISSYI